MLLNIFIFSIVKVDLWMECGENPIKGGGTQNYKKIFKKKLVANPSKVFIFIPNITSNGKRFPGTKHKCTHELNKTFCCAFGALLLSLFYTENNLEF